MTLAEIVEGKKEALRVTEIAEILDISIKKIYRMAAKGQIPSLKISRGCYAFQARALHMGVIMMQAKAM